ncbi:MAG: hypothetical protein HY840_02765 [Bacteroidetes bacterium]|nr:hypothetical protein [Bacteroidota bacterium]
MKNEQANEKKSTVRLELKPYTPLQLSKIYGVSKVTFLKWIKELKQELGKRNGHYYSIPQVKIIFSEFLLPSYIEIETDIIVK